MCRGAPCVGGPRVRICLSLCAAMVVLLTPAAAQAAKPAFLKGHPYRHGAVPFHGHSKLNGATQITAGSANNLTYQGANTGAGVETGAEKMYLVFWGSQWGSQGTNGSGYATFTGDSAGVAPDLQSFFKGLGTGGETWSGVMTQYCDGVATGAQTCPAANTQHVAYPTGGALAGVWEDTSAAAPSAASGHAIGAEAVNAATHFGNTTQASNTNAQYVIVSPHGTDPDNYETGGFCAWHDYTGDSTLDGGGAVSSPDGTLAFTNLPYIPDAEPPAAKDSSTARARSTASRSSRGTSTRRRPLTRGRRAGGSMPAARRTATSVPGSDQGRAPPRTSL